MYNPFQNLMTNVIPLKSGNSVVGLVSRGTSAIPSGGKKFSLLQNVQTGRRIGGGALSGGKMASTEDDHYSAEVKNGWSNTSILCMSPWLAQG